MAQRRITSLKQGLNELGWTESKNISFEIRLADGKLDRLPQLATEIVDSKVDIIVTSGTPLIEAVRKATTTIPVVMAAVGDAVGAGFVASLAHPGGNMTGLSLVASEGATKRLQLLKEVITNLKDVAVLWHVTNASHQMQMKELEPAASSLGIRVHSLAADRPNEIEGAIKSLPQQCQALRARLAALASS